MANIRIAKTIIVAQINLANLNLAQMVWLKQGSAN